MAIMTIRTTVAFDPATAARLERLSQRWGVSKSETLRRALEKAEVAASAPSSSSEPTFEEIASMSPADAFAWLNTHSLITPEQGAAWREQVEHTRADFASRP
jgi:hypothetical protein